MEVLDAINEQIDDILGVAHVHNSTYRNIYLTLSDALRSQLAVTLEISIRNNASSQRQAWENSQTKSKR